jgi:hypothetical protein
MSKRTSCNAEHAMFTPCKMAITADHCTFVIYHLNFFISFNFYFKIYLQLMATILDKIVLDLKDLRDTPPYAVCELCRSLKQTNEMSKV